MKYRKLIVEEKLDQLKKIFYTIVSENLFIFVDSSICKCWQITQKLNKGLNVKSVSDMPAFTH